ncbi:MAG: ankyrin repeat domain-containing protein [Elusimicrobiaceae bacterium]|nr:ankyrin repeat domain-containing protein [Elusimicrobiaceae bacterium]
MKKLSLLFLAILLCAGFVKAQDADDPELQALIKAYKAMKASQAPKKLTKEEQQKRYERALIESAKEGNASQVRGLLEQGVNPNVSDENGDTPLNWAAYKGDLASVDMLLYAGADVNWKKSVPLLSALNRVNNSEVIFRILKEKPDVNAFSCSVGKKTNFYTCTNALMRAVEQNSVEVVEELIKQGADVNKFYAPGGSALRLAIMSKATNSTKMVEILLKAGADPWRIDGFGDNPLKVAKVIGNKEKINLIKEAQKATKEQHKKDGELIAPVSKIKADKVKKLLAEGASPEADCEIGASYKASYANSDKPAYGRTPLMCSYGRPEIAQLLLDAGADINAVDGMGNTVLHNTFVAKDDTGIDEFNFLLKHGADINARNIFGRTPLYENILRGPRWERKTVLLLEAGADPNIRNAYGSTPLMYAKKDRNEQLASLLQQYGATLTKSDEADIEKYFAQKEAERAQAANDGDSLGKTFLKGLVDTGMATMQYGIQNGKF